MKNLNKLVKEFLRGKGFNIPGLNVPILDLCLLDSTMPGCPNDPYKWPPLSRCWISTGGDIGTTPPWAVAAEPCE